MPGCDWDHLLSTNPQRAIYFSAETAKNGSTIAVKRTMSRGAASFLGEGADFALRTMPEKRAECDLAHSGLYR
jgi:hypothetical protein